VVISSCVCIGWLLILIHILIFRRNGKVRILDSLVSWVSGKFFIVRRHWKDEFFWCERPVVTDRVYWFKTRIILNWHWKFCRLVRGIFGSRRLDLWRFHFRNWTVLCLRISILGNCRDLICFFRDLSFRINYFHVLI